MKKGIIAKYKDEVDIADIRNIQVKQSIIQRLWSCGSVLIGTAGTAGIEIAIVNIGNPTWLADLIRSQKAS